MSERNLCARLVSSLEKGILTERVESYPELKSISVLRGERLNFQLFLRTEVTGDWRTRRFEITVEGLDASAREVKNVFADLPYYGVDKSRENGMTVESPSGLYPDVLEPIDSGVYLRPKDETLTAVWFEATPREAGVLGVSVVIKENGEQIASLPLTVTVVDAALPEQSTIFTQWFYCDCLASYYDVPVFSEKHWQIVRNFMACAVRHGINFILTPVFTPPLDTEIGTERPTVQLVGVVKNGGEYSFDFSLLKRWLDMARDVGVRYFEIAHLFTQWGAANAPKVVATVDGIERRIFGWHTPGKEGEYPRFLAKFLPELVAFLKAEGVFERCRFHISDEPGEAQFESYVKARNLVEPYIDGAVIMDAMSSVKFLKEGAVTTPIPATSGIEPFLAEDIAERWTYYCCGEFNKVGNRFIAYPQYRNRILGVQFYKFNITGFLQWGYNYYYSVGARRLINPYINTSADGQLQSGDSFSVYPGPMGTPLASTRLAVFHEALQDVEALKLAESVVGRGKVVALIDELAGEPVTFSEYPKSAEYILTLREKVNEIIEEKL